MDGIYKASRVYCNPTRPKYTVTFVYGFVRIAPNMFKDLI